MKLYNMQFLIAGFILLLTLFYHFLKQRRINDTNNGVFRFYIIIGILDLFFDIVSTILMSGDYPEKAFETRIILSVFYIFQVLLPYFILFYAQSLRNCKRELLIKTMKYLSLPAIVMILIVIANFRNGYIFYFDPAGNYFRGKWYYLVYFHAAFYGILTLLGSIYHLNELTTQKFHAICQFLFIEVIAVGIQAATGLLTIGFGISIGILFLYLSINNPNSYTDNLTGVFDKNFFQHWLQDQITRKKSIHILAIEMYQLKQINSLIGSEFGDQLLLQISEKLQSISYTGSVYRTGGDQFILSSNTIAEYEKQRNELQEYFEQPFKVGSEFLKFPSIICGVIHVAEFSDNDELEAYLEYLISLVPKDNQTAMIQSDQKTMEGFRYKQEVSRYLTTAVEQDLFEIYYQPVFSAENESVVTAEALSRLNHPTLGNIPPDLFISLAERNGLICDLALLQFRRVCKLVKDHPQLLSILQNIKFNLSPMELVKTGHAMQLIQIIREYQLPPDFFQFEITENVTMQYNRTLQDSIQIFLNNGVSLCLDDFGSGYANLNTVLKLPFSCVKLDRTLLTDICTNPQVATFYESIVRVLQKLHFLVVSEGVETERELNLLRSWEVDLIQGFYFSRPLSSDDLLKTLSLSK